MSWVCSSHLRQGNRSPGPCRRNLAQNADLRALTRALELSYEAILQERGLLTSGNKDIKHAKEILQLLEAVILPNQVAVAALPRAPGEQFPNKLGSQTAADKAGRQAAQRLPLLGALIPHLDLSEFKPHYIEQNGEWAHARGFSNPDCNSVGKITLMV